MIVNRLEAKDQLIPLHARQDAGQAGAQDTALCGQFVKLNGTVIGQYANDAPLLLCQVVAFQDRAEEPHGGFTRLQQGDG
ncbi:hypothetical protein D3C78_1803470 [compost metagenome]